MLHCAVALFAVGLVAAMLGFGGVAALSVGVAKVLFVMFAVLSVAGYLMRLFPDAAASRRSMNLLPHLKKE